MPGFMKKIWRSRRADSTNPYLQSIIIALSVISIVAVVCGAAYQIDVVHGGSSYNNAVNGLVQQLWG